jgi:hypothetical protein
MSDTQQSKASERFNQLSAHATEAQNEIKASAAKNRADLSKQVDRAREAADTRTAALKSYVSKEKEKASDHWSGVQDSWQNLTSKAHGRADDKHAEQDAKHAEHRAERAERDASFSRRSHDRHSNTSGCTACRTSW